MVCSIAPSPEGLWRIVLDDLDQHEAPVGAWKHRARFTYKEYPARELRDLSLSDEALAELGFYVVARLMAIDPKLNEEPQ